MQCREMTFLGQRSLLRLNPRLAFPPWASAALIHEGSWLSCLTWRRSSRGNSELSGSVPKDSGLPRPVTQHSPHFACFRHYVIWKHTVGFYYSNKINASSLKGVDEENLWVWPVL